MQVKQYLYQSPSTSSVQVGKLDPSTQKSDDTKTSSETIQKPQNQSAQAISATKIDIYA